MYSLPICNIFCRIISLRYGTGTLTNAFLDRVFQECLTYEGEMVNIKKNIFFDFS